jgi:hypothetical protein
MSTGIPDSSSPAGLPTTFAKYGTVGARWTHNMSTGKDSIDTATVFVDYGALGSLCTRTSIDSCVHVSCPGPEAGAPPLVDPGTVVIGTPPVQFTLTFTGPNSTMAGSMPGALWQAGTTIPMTSQGSPAVPPWSTTVTMPPLATVTAPMIAGSAMTSTRQSDFSVAWTGTPDITLSFSSNFGSEQLSCTYSGGHAVLPAADLGLLPPGVYDLTIFTANRQYFQAGDWSIRATADTDAICVGGVPCDIGSFTLE